MAKATQEHMICLNLLERQFGQGKPEKMFLTDINYLKYNERTWAYLSCVKDRSTKEILAHYLSTSLEMPIVEIRDNASIESFFAHMKDELEVKDCKSIEELRKRVDDYIQFYNTNRFQWTLKKMTPWEYRSHLLVA